MSLKKLLIISPYFPPINAADMQRVRMSLPYFAANGWDAEVVTVDERYANFGTDPLLLQSVPVTIKVHKVKALRKQVTLMIGLGSIALRSLWFYRQYVNKLLKHEKFDLVYFSTTQFPLCILGAYWLKKFNVPYIIDMQDPWFSDYYQDKLPEDKPDKHWFSYRLNKYTEPLAMKKVSGLISVSNAYITDLKKRYPVIKTIPSKTITFSAFEPDMQIAEANHNLFPDLLDAGFINMVYIGRGGTDMHQAITPLFRAVKASLDKGNSPLKKLRIYFIGTSYAENGRGVPTIAPLAKLIGIEDMVIEFTDRISYYHTLLTLKKADALFIPGSDDPKYTASKIYPYLMTLKPILAIFNQASSSIAILEEYGVEHLYNYQAVTDTTIENFLVDLVNNNLKNPHYESAAIHKYSAANMTLNQCDFFNEVLGEKN